MKFFFISILTLLFSSVYAFNDGDFPIVKRSTVDSSSIFINDIPFLKICDSIYSYSFINDAEIYSEFNNYSFPKDSIPTYLDTTYSERIYLMNSKSPFSFQYNEAVKSMIMFYSNKRIKHLSKILDSKDLYFPLFEELLDKYQLPLELKYLAIVESALNPKAKSRVGAMGLWQFMPATGRLYGLHANSRVDDRMNIYKSTEAACQHFADLYARYNDWNLVLAAYNAGPGNVNKAIRKCGTSTDYWEIRKFLPRETQNYVPAFIAVNYLMQYSKAHNIQAANINRTSYFEIDTIHINENIYFKNIADWLEIDIEQIKKLNPQFKQNFIPSSKTRKYILTLPNSEIAEFLLNKHYIISGISRKEYENQAIK